MKKWNMIVDVAKCNNCYNCFIATKDEYVDMAHPGYTAPQPLHGHSWVNMEYRESGQWPMVKTSFRPVMCNHCDDAPCMKVAKNNAITKRDDGIVIIDPEKSKGQKEIVDACPYGAIYWNEESEIPQAWPFDAHLIDQGWDTTKLDKVCPTDVFRSIKVTDQEMQQLANKENLETLEPKDGAKPRVYYKNNHLFTTCFVGGTVITIIDGREDCVEGAAIKISKDGKVLGETTSDGFGDFRFEKLPRGLGNISIDVEVDGKPAVSQTAEIHDSLYLGCIEV